MIRSSHAEYSDSCSNIFYWASYFCFLLEEDGNNIKCKQTLHCHSRLSKPILKILSIYRKNILGKQLSQAISSKYLFRLLHAPIFKFFSIRLNMVKVVELKKLLWWILQGNAYAGGPFLIKFHAYRLKKDPYTGVFLWVLPNISEPFFFFAKRLWVTASTQYLFLFVTSTSSTKVSFNLGYFKYFWDKHCELLANSSWRSWADSQPLLSC